MEIFSSNHGKTISIVFVDEKSLKIWNLTQTKKISRWIKDTGFFGEPGKMCLIPDDNGSLHCVLVGISDPFSLWDTGGLAYSLPKGKYHFENCKDSEFATKAVLGWAFGAYCFDKYKKGPKLRSKLCWPKLCNRKEVTQILDATFLVRNLINTPADDMGPSQLEKVSRKISSKNGATIRVIKGKNLLSKNYPAIYAVGRASDNIPRLIDITWGDTTHPKVTLVGKGVCFDTGGLDIKSASGMKFMKKDMGGAAHVLGIASMLMEAKTKVRLRVLIPAVENNISGNSLRPLDVIKSRSGKTIEIGHTDAEGRVILADALFEGSQQNPSLIIDFATLTGAARIALGAELPAFFTNSDVFSEIAMDMGEKNQDPLWRLPLWGDYQRHNVGKSADLTNSPETPFGGAITAALFLKEFIKPGVAWAHIDLMAWNSATRPGRPEGGEAMGLRAIHKAILAWLER